MEQLYLEAAQKLARRDDPQTSKDAAEKMVKSGALNRQEKWVYERIKKYRNDDFTTKDIAAIAWEVGVEYYRAYDICRKRFSDLHWKGKIEPIWLGVNEKTGKNIYKRRDGCQCWRLRNE